ncbi:predicted protein [Streptomyces viridosporus ATCC 14672]|uniref:Predicted protein n=1 Tax=Streptomyces viridosporus (strain ATCC 14672 / DSM 40746 / JCM 4963 / KCTC 9882 / NRRL B-12104 / FH 1290) TaxID=566461 RepID=D6A5J6_STRV1|nr:predicted protein [Streptomyces viridosporus ATCC 14672]
MGAAMTRVMGRCRPGRRRTWWSSRPHSCFALRKHSSIVQRLPATRISSSGVASAGRHPVPTGGPVPGPDLDAGPVVDAPTVGAIPARAALPRPAPWTERLRPCPPGR